MKKTGIAVVGCGAMAQGMHLPNVIRHPELELLWCCDVNETLLSEVQKKFSPKKMTLKAEDVARDPECKMVILSTTQSARYDLIRLFSENGKHIYVEKPMADGFEEMFAIARQIKKTGVKFCVGHNRRMAPAAQEALRIYLKHKANPVSPAWRWDRAGSERPALQEEKQTVILLRINDDYWSWKGWAFGHGALINEMTHFADLACFFLEEKPVRVTTLGSKMANHTVVIEFEGGSLATIVAAGVGSFGYPKELIEIYHQGAAIIIDHLLEVRTAGVVDEPFRQVFPLHDGKTLKDGIAGYYEETIAAQQRAVSQGDNSLLAPLPNKGHYELLDAFLKEVRGGNPTPNTIDQAMKSTAVILRAIESDEKKTSVGISHADYTV